METMPALFTRRDYDALPEGFPAQLVRGRLVKEASPVYGHQTLAFRIAKALDHLLPEDRIFVAPVDVPIDEHNVYQPDVSVFSQVPPPGARCLLVPIVVFEVLSPSSRRRDRGVKCRNYLAAGVLEVWIVDADERSIEVHTSGGRVAARETQSAASHAIPGFALVPAALFGPAR